MTRGELAEVLYRLNLVLDGNLDKFRDTTQPTSNEYTITIPKLNIIDLNVSFANPHNSQSALDVLKYGLGHYLATPGSGQKMVLFGHSSGYGWDNSNYKQVLRQIDKLDTGDKIYVNYHEKGYVYQIFNKEVMSATLLEAVMKDYGYEEMALYTCWPPDSVSHRYGFN
jgi:LPXTG-site transpeptidase (sortase) family protein